MLFNSLPFLAFLFVFLIAYWQLRGTRRLWLCLLGSYFFYAWWDYRFLSLILASSLLDYAIGLGIQRASNPGVRRGLLTASVVANLGLLGVFKYCGFFSESLQELAAMCGWQLDWPTLNIVLPVGISFYTFQTMSYSIDVYRRKIAPETNLLRFATYVAFFPQLVAGPIVRASCLLPQLQVDSTFRWTQFETGFALVLVGFFKKVVIADSLAILVDHLFDNPGVYTAVNTVILIGLYAFQIYGDFSGYSDIAIGVALMLGLEFPRNFNFPYFATSFGDFWKRWHISLSEWLRDYLYIPLGGSRHGALRTSRNIAITMLLGGLWHGANWTFVLWGSIHALFLFLQHALSGRESKSVGLPAAQAETDSSWSRLIRMLWSSPQIVCVFAVVCLAWVVFRSADVAQAWSVLQQIGGLDGLSPSTLQDRIALIRGCVLVAILVLAELAYVLGCWSWLDSRFALARPLTCACLLWLIALFGTFESNAFIYFQF